MAEIRRYGRVCHEYGRSPASSVRAARDHAFGRVISCVFGSLG